MQHLAVRLAVTLLTFCTGLAASALWNIFTPAPVHQAGVLTARESACPSSKPADEPPSIVTVTRIPVVISGGILNGKAVSKPAPAYPAIAKAARAEGTVVVRLTVDESGGVEEAAAVSGHPLLQAAAVSAVRQWRFTPTLLSGQPVKVSGVVNVNFILQ